MAAPFQRVPLAIHFQYVHLGVAVGNKSSDAVCPTGSAWRLPGPTAL